MSVPRAKPRAANGEPRDTEITTTSASNPGTYSVRCFAVQLGLGVGTKVTIAGMEVGQVTEVVLTDDRRVRVGLNVESTYAGHVRTDSVGSAAMTLSGKVVRIEAGSLESPPLEDGGTLVSGSNFDVLRALENMDLVDNIERLEAILIDLNELAGQMNLGDGRLPETVEGLLQLVEDLQEGRGTVGRLLKDEATLNEITDAIGAIDRMAGSVAAIEHRVQSRIWMRGFGLLHHRAKNGRPDGAGRVRGTQQQNPPVRLGGRRGGCRDPLFR